MFLLYADEFGHDGIWDPSDPNYAHHPLFGLAGFAIRAEAWRDLDRRYFRLKKSFYAREIGREVARSRRRPERFEAKTLSSRRDRRFAHAVFDLLDALDATVFVQGVRKPTGGPHDSDALYGSVTQALMRAFEKFIRNKVGKSGKGLILIDRRSEARDIQLLASAQSHLFSAAGDLRGGFDRLIEVPMLVRSEWHHGVQAADNVARVVGRVFRCRAAADKAHARVEAEFGPRIDRLAFQVRPAWSTIFVR